jgi:hypothetical protein
VDPATPAAAVRPLVWLYRSEDSTTSLARAMRALQALRETCLYELVTRCGMSMVSWSQGEDAQHHTDHTIAIYERDKQTVRPSSTADDQQTFLSRRFAPASSNGKRSFFLSVGAVTVISGGPLYSRPSLQLANRIARYGIGTTRLSPTDYARNVRDEWHATTNKRIS